jgi:hypothetical protein
MENNPYTSPAANLFGSTSGTSVEYVSTGVIHQLKRTKPWVRFFGVILWIAVSFMILAAVAMVVGGAAMGTMMQQTNPGMPAGLITGFGAVYILMAVLYIYPAIKIWKYGSSIGKLVQSGSHLDLEEALNQQRGFWKFVGVMMIIGIGMYLLGIVVMFGFAATAVAGLPK